MQSPHTLPVVVSNVQRAGAFFIPLQGHLMVHPRVVRVPSEHDKVGWLEEMAEGFGAC